MALTTEEKEYRKKISDKYLGILSPATERDFERQGDYEYYDGDYVITPLAFKSQTLRTSGKLMRGDIIVKEIPFTEATNFAGGLTANIAKTVDVI